MANAASDNFEFQIIAGTLKRKKISAPNLGGTRPPLTRLRKSIFDFLNPYLRDAAYLDLFSGTGSYLFEAVSRGVTTAVGVELAEPLVVSINDQAAKFGVADALECRHGDVFEVVPELYGERRLFDIVLIAPPQYVGLVGRTLKTIEQFPLVAEGGLILCQHDSSETSKINWSGFEVSQRRKYGNTTFTILQPGE